MNWESRVDLAKDRVIVSEAGKETVFERQPAASAYQSGTGERLVFDQHKGAILARQDGSSDVFDAQGRLIRKDYRNGNLVVVHYGKHGFIEWIEGPKKTFLKFTYDNANRAIQVESSTGRKVQYGYTGDSLSAVHVLPSRATARYTYSANGMLSAVQDSQSGTTEFQYDGQGRLVLRRFADGSSERYSYDQSGMRHTDVLGATTIVHWSPDGKQMETTDPLGGKTVTEFDSSGRLVLLTDPTGGRARFTYYGEHNIPCRQTAAYRTESL